jgi:hypothetical protein
MAKYRIKAPDGNNYEIEGPENATEDQIREAVIRGNPHLAQKPMSALDVGTQALSNFVPSSIELGKSVAQPFLHPIDTAKAVGELGNSVLGKMGVTNADPSKADAVGKYFADRYGGIENAKRTFATDPAGFLADASTVLLGGGSALRAIPKALGTTGGAVGRAGEVLTKAAATIDPITAATKAAKLTGSAAKTGLGFTTGTGSETIGEAFKAGVTGGKQGEAFVSQMRGTAPTTDVVTSAREGLANLRKQRSEAYRNDMSAIKADPTVLNFNRIDTAIKSVQDRGYFKGKEKNPKAAEAWDDIKKAVDEWKTDDPTQFHTPEGIDALKQRIGSIRDSLPFGTPARNAADEVYRTIRGEITKQAPSYGNVMKDYEEASDLINQLEQSLSLGKKAQVDTTVRKLQSILRNNANTNYGRRMELGRELEAQGATQMFPQLAGQALSSPAPRGLQGIGSALTLGATALSNPAYVGALGVTMPRVVGEAVYKTGQAVGKPMQLAQALAKRGKAFVQRYPEMAMAVDRVIRTGGDVPPELAKKLAYQLAQFDRMEQQQ